MSHVALPHSQLVELRDVPKVVAEFLADAKRQEAYFAVSQSFWDVEAQRRYESVYAAYRGFYDRILRSLIEHLGPPDWQGNWEDPGYPEWAVGEHIAVWGNPGDPYYLSIYHEDREVPILVRLSWANRDDTNSSSGRGGPTTRCS
jgi:hypothetical protein